MSPNLRLSFSLGLQQQPVASSPCRSIGVYMFWHANPRWRIRSRCLWDASVTIEQSRNDGKREGSAFCAGGKISCRRMCWTRPFLSIIRRRWESFRDCRRSTEEVPFRRQSRRSLAQLRTPSGGLSPSVPPSALKKQSIPPLLSMLCTI